MNHDLRIVLVGTQIDLRDGKKKKAKASDTHKVVIPEELKKASEHPRYCLAQMPVDVLQQIFSYERCGVVVGCFCFLMAYHTVILICLIYTLQCESRSDGIRLQMDVM